MGQDQELVKQPCSESRMLSKVIGTEHRRNTLNSGERELSQKTKVDDDMVDPGENGDAVMLWRDEDVAFAEDTCSSVDEMMT